MNSVGIVVPGRGLLPTGRILADDAVPSERDRQLSVDAEVAAITDVGTRSERTTGVATPRGFESVTFQPRRSRKRQLAAGNMYANWLTLASQLSKGEHTEVFCASEQSANNFVRGLREARDANPLFRDIVLDIVNDTDTDIYVVSVENRSEE